MPADMRCRFFQRGDAPIATGLRHPRDDGRASAQCIGLSRRSIASLRVSLRCRADPEDARD